MYQRVCVRVSHLCVSVHVSVCVHVFELTFLCPCMRVCVCMFVFVSVCVCVCRTGEYTARDAWALMDGVTSGW